MDTGHGSEGHKDEYSFLQETIKDEVLSPKKFIAKSFKWLAFGVLFGAAACTTFFALKPWAENTFQEEPDEVEIHQSEEEQEQQASEEQEPEKEEEADTPDVQVEPEERELTIKDYYVLSTELKNIAVEAQKCVTKISGVAQEQDWISDQAGYLDNTSGLIVADNGRELLVLASYSALKDAKIFQVEFADGTRHQASLKQKDANLDLAVFCVAKDDISEETWDNIAIAKIGNSKGFVPGRTLIAVGQPFGFENGIGYGISSANNQKITRADGEYEVLITDMAYAVDGNGFLFDLYGNVIGMIAPNVWDVEVMVAYGISDITNVIEMMSNGKYIPYAGIVGTMVTEETAELYGIPVGLYVSEVEKDSPAMKAGIQNGDIITKMGATEILSLEVYHNALYALEAGSSVKFIGQRYGTEEYIDIDFTVTIGIKE